MTGGRSQKARPTDGECVASALRWIDNGNKGAYTRNMIKDPVDFSLCRDCACAGARRASRELTRAFDDALRETGVRVTQFNLLATLVLAGPTAATRLAALLGLERTTLTRNLRPLLRDGLVRFDGDRDRRVRKIAITAKGEETARAAFPFWKRAQDAAQARAAGLATHSA